jgi:membrane-associated phospholipid phosphatase
MMCELRRRITCCALVVVTWSGAAPLCAQSLLTTTPPAATETAAATLPIVAEPEVGGLGWLVESTVSDFRRLPSHDTLRFLTIGASAAFMAGFADQSSSQQISSSRVLDSTLTAGQTLGGARMQLIGALATYTAGRISGSPRTASVGADLLRAQFLSQALTAGIKLSVRRTRPDGTQYSFPSGHSSVSFATATVLQRDLGWKVGVPAYAMATYVAASRVQDRRHFLSDVAFGAALGIAAGRTVTVGRGDARFAVAPAAVPGGAAVSFAWVGSR